MLDEDSSFKYRVSDLGLGWANPNPSHGHNYSYPEAYLIGGRMQ